MAQPPTPAYLRAAAERLVSELKQSGPQWTGFRGLAIVVSDAVTVGTPDRPEVIVTWTSSDGGPRQDRWGIWPEMQGPNGDAEPEAFASVILANIVESEIHRTE